jgi:hypothetical protein
MMPQLVLDAGLALTQIYEKRCIGMTEIVDPDIPQSHFFQTLLIRIVQVTIITGSSRITGENKFRSCPMLQFNFQMKAPASFS